MKTSIAQQLRRKQAQNQRRLSRKSRRSARTHPGITGIKYEISERIGATAVGGIGLAVKMLRDLDLPKLLIERLKIFKIYNPYNEADHVLNLALNTLAGGRTIDDIEYRRNDLPYLDALGVTSIPDPTTAGDFCRRFAVSDIMELQRIINDVRLKVWREQPPEFFDRAKIDADGVLVGTHGECKKGMDISYKGVWGYHVLNVSLANTQEPLFLINRPGNQRSREGAAPIFDEAAELCLRAGFRRISFRGDTDFSQTACLDQWDKAGYEFNFGIAVSPTLRELAEFIPDEVFDKLERSFPEIQTVRRKRRERIKEQIVEQRGYRNIRLLEERVAEFEYQPGQCEQPYRLVVLRKTLQVTERNLPGVFPEFRYFLFITNRRDLTAKQIVLDANQRCNQENLNAQLKGGIKALRAPLDTLESNWAYMVMTALAWSIKAWMALRLPIDRRDVEKSLRERSDLLKMEFRRFAEAMIKIPCQILRTGRRIIYRVLAWNPWLPAFFRFAHRLNC